MDQLKTEIEVSFSRSDTKSIIKLTNELLQYVKENESEELYAQVIREYKSVAASLLHQAVRQNNLDIVRSLLSSNINPNVQDDQGHTALNVAQYNKATTVENYLLGYIDGYEAACL